METVNEILLRRKNKIIADKKDYLNNHHEKCLIVGLIKNIESLGYTIDKELFEILSTYNKDELSVFYKGLMPILKKLTGADKEYHPMYPNFPQQVEEASDIELLLNAIVHYFTFGQWMPEYEKEERLPLLDVNKMTVLSAGTHEDLMDIFVNLVNSKSSLSTQDKEDVEWFIVNCNDYAKYLPETIPLKENVALIGKLVIQKAPFENTDSIQKYFKTATDVLRLVVALSDGDISLAAETKFKHLNRRERRMIMNLLAGCGNLVEDMFRYQYEWIRIGEIVHPFEFYQQKYKDINSAFIQLRSGKKPLMFAGKVQEALLKPDIKRATDLLKTRAGDFARQLDKLLRDANDSEKNYIINSFKDVAKNVSTNVLLQVRQHFKERKDNKNPYRVFFPKGNVAKAIVIENDLKKIGEKYCNYICNICDAALIENYKEREYLGNVYVDSELSNYLVPFSQRSASSGSKIIVRGSHVPIKDDAEAVRAFIWWTNTGDDDRNWADTVDIDLSAAIFDENWNFVEHVSYTRLRSEKMCAYHSGDIINGGSVNGEGVAEFLDVNLSAVKESGRYIVYQIYSYNQQKFSTLPNCRFGWMEREDVNSGEIFEPKTVVMNMDVSAPSYVAIPVIFDTYKKEFIWTDMNIDINKIKNCIGGNNLESNLGNVKEVVKAITHLNKPNVYDLVTLNAISRGTIVNNRNEADIIFSNDTTVPVKYVEKEVARNSKTGEIITESVEKEKTGIPIITAFDTDYIMGQLI